MRLIEMVRDMALKLGQNQRCPLRTLFTESARYIQAVQNTVTYATFVSNRILDLDLI